ncbi:MAG: hypothetical protein P3W87_007490 [Gammaproteobacteria bacterium]|nr:hypothetical protein [Gammaproteobacteria bacterium]
MKPSALESYVRSVIAQETQKWAKPIVRSENNAGHVAFHERLDEALKDDKATKILLNNLFILARTGPNDEWKPVMADVPYDDHDADQTDENTEERLRP